MSQTCTPHPIGLRQHSCAGPCHRCLFPEAPCPDACGRCSDAGVLGPVPGIIGTLQAMEAIKVVTGAGQTLSRRLLLLDALQGRMHTVKLRARVRVALRCRACSGAVWVVIQVLRVGDAVCAVSCHARDCGCPRSCLM